MQAAEVAIFWDYQNCHASDNVSGYQVVANVRNAAHKYGRIASLRAYWEVPDGTPKNLALRNELQSSGVSIVDTRSHVAGQMLVVDMLTWAIDHPRATFFIITGDTDFAYAISTLRLRKYEIVVVSLSTNSSLKSQASVWLEWNRNVMGYPPGTPSSSSSSSTTTSTPTTRPANLQIHTLHKTEHPQPSPARTNGFVNGYAAESPLPSPQPGAAPAYTTNVSRASDVEALDTPRSPLEQPQFEEHDAPPHINLDPVNLTLVDEQPRCSYSPPFSAPANNIHNHVAPTAFSPPPPSPRPPSVARSQSLNAPASSFFPAPEFLPNVGRAPVVEEEWTPKSMPETRLPPSPPRASTSATRLPPASPAPSTIVAVPVSAPEVFQPLINVLTAHAANGERQPQRCIVGQELNKSVYKRAGVQTFAAYTTLAEQQGFIRLGGTGSTTWISLSNTPRLTGPATVFQPLVNLLYKRHVRGETRLLAHLVPSSIAGGKTAFAAAGVRKYHEYLALAAQAKVVQMGGTGAEEWVALHPSLVASL
ncbi:NYN domain-containing protein [Mycena kentingensis (nom. inval.)]|nr:NYN domain-containing protein [Mycena kentingensis (nom. inval.)]